VKDEAEVADLEALYRSRYAHFLRIAGLVTADDGAAHDAVQEGFAAAIRSLPSYRGEGPLEAWVWRAVVNAALKGRRKASVLALEEGALRPSVDCFAARTAASPFHAEANSSCDSG
jgi:DNA-directed RNA polymerase specialized sigma24 family protein